MPNDELRPRVAEILHSEHRAALGAIRALDAQDSAELLEIASGATHPEFRVKAMTLAASAGHETAGELFRDALRDPSADDTVRAAGATWLSRFAAANAEASLIDALHAESTAAVQHKIIAGLARVGTDDSLRTLSAIIDQEDSGLSQHAQFARSLVAYRLGRTGFELPVVGASDMLPTPSPAKTSAIFEVPDREARPRVVEQIAADDFGMPADYQSAAWLRCGRQQLAIVISSQVSESPGESLSRPTIAGQVALQAESDGSLHTSMIVMCWPRDASGVYISVNRLTGRTMYFGSGHVEGESVPFHLDAVRGPGARETTITGTLVAGTLTRLEVGLGRKLETLRPTPIDDPQVMRPS